MVFWHRGYNTYREIFCSIAFGTKVAGNIAARQTHGNEEISARQPAIAEQPFCFFPTLPIKLRSYRLLSKRKDVIFAKQADWADSRHVCLRKN